MCRPNANQKLQKNKKKKHKKKKNQGGGQSQTTPHNTSIDLRYDAQLLSELKNDEGYRNKVYKCSQGYPTVGIGHKLVPSDNIKEGDTISDERVKQLFANDVGKAVAGAKRIFGNETWNKLSLDKQRVFVNMVFQMGEGGVSKFDKVINAVKRNDFNEASKEMLNSLWAKQTPNRAHRLANRIKN